MKILFPLFFFLFFLLSFFVSGVIDSQDGQLYLAVARYIYYTGEPTAPPYEYKNDGTGQNIHMGTYVGQDGKTYSPTGLGYTFALLPTVFITDLIHRLYQTPVQLEHFPLQSDWLTLFTASFVNAIFGALLGVIIFLYLLELKLNKFQALTITLVAIFATNLWPYAKHSFAHMMFISFLVLTFYLVKRYFNSQQNKFLFYSGISFGICALTYNQSFTLSIISLIVYYFLLSKSQLNKVFLKKALKDFAVFFMAFIPFFLVFVLFELLRYRVWTTLPGENFVRTYKVLFSVPTTVFIEGIYGQLLSPGRSIFIYSPILVLLILFWEKLKDVKAELTIFLIFSITYVGFFASLYVIEEPEYGARGLWDGELSWGPRYLLPLIPFALLLIGKIYQHLSKKQKIFIFMPLVLAGFFVNFIGVFLPYQLKLQNLEPELFINGHKYTSFSYQNLITRHTPILSMAKATVKHIRDFPKTINHSDKNVRFYDGFGFPFTHGNDRWRTIDQTGYILFDGKDVSSISLKLFNQSLDEASKSAATFQFSLNHTNLNSEKLVVNQEKEINFSINPSILKDNNNFLIIYSQFDNPKVMNEKTQIAGINSMSINNQPVNLETFDYPFVSDLGPGLTGIKYYIYGNEIKDPWKIWDIHTQIYERTPDFWWLKPLYYWDLPKSLFLILFLSNLFGILISGFALIKGLRNRK